MPKKKPSKTLTIELDRFYDRLAWYEWRGRMVEAETLRDFAAWFTPPLRVDESIVEERIQEFIAAEKRLNDPMNWT